MAGDGGDLRQARPDAGQGGSLHEGANIARSYINCWILWSSASRRFLSISTA